MTERIKNFIRSVIREAVQDVAQDLKADVAGIRAAVDSLAQSNHYLAAAERYDRESRMHKADF